MRARESVPVSVPWTASIKRIMKSWRLPVASKTRTATQKELKTHEWSSLRNARASPGRALMDGTNARFHSFMYAFTAGQRQQKRAFLIQF